MAPAAMGFFCGSPLSLDCLEGGCFNQQGPDGRAAATNHAAPGTSATACQGK